METKQTYDNLNETLILGFNSIFKIVGLKKILWSNWINCMPIILALIFIIFCLIFKIDFFESIKDITNLMINFLPGILGYTVAGYSLMIGLIQAGMLNRITEPCDDKNKFSLYQTMSSTFAVNIMIQAIALIIAFLFHFIMYLDKNKKEIFFYENELCFSILNGIGLFIIFYFFSISLFMIIQVIINIFNFSQLHHYFVNKEKIEQKNKLKTK
jgi:hypothetical protein